MWEDNLENRMKEVCPHCGNHWEEVIEYIKEHDKDPKALYEEAIHLSDYESGDFAQMVLSSNYNIFVPWYKAFLIYVKNNAKTGSSWIANDILDYYKEDFDEVVDL